MARLSTLHKTICCLGALVLLASCTEGDGSEPSAAGNGGGGGEVDRGGEFEAEELDWAIEYTGGTEGPADDSLEPVRVGFINQEGGPLAFPDVTAGAEAAVEFLNEHLGGIEGHPLELVQCPLTVEEDGQRCGGQMRNDDGVDLVVTGMMIQGSESLNTTIAGEKPIFISTMLSPPDYVADNAYSFNGGAPTANEGLGYFIAEELDAESVGIIYSDSPAGSSTAAATGELLRSFGIEDVTNVPVPDTATGPAAASALQAAGGDDVDVLLLRGSVQACVSIAEALDTLPTDVPVVTPETCLGSLAEDHFQGDWPENWNYLTFGYNYFEPDLESGMQTYARAFANYAPDENASGYARYSFATILTAARFMNDIGFDQLSAETLAAAAQEFEGPAMMQAGDLECGHQPDFPVLCAKAVGFQRFEDGEWVNVANGLNGSPIFPWGE